MPVLLGNDFIQWTDPVLGLRTLYLRVPLQRVVPSIRQKRISNDSLDYSVREVISSAQAVKELTGTISYQDQPQLILEMLLFGAQGGELTYYSTDGSSFTGILVEPSGDLIDLLLQEDSRPAFAEYQIPIRLRGEFVPVVVEHVSTPTGSGSLEKRTDAIAHDYRTAFCMGPVGRVDVTEGLFAYAWRVRLAEDGGAYLARANLDGTAWSSEFLEASLSSDSIEIDVAFDQTGRPVFCTERPNAGTGNSEIWLYWFDSRVSQFVYNKVADGRNPRLVLDMPEDLSNSDILLFYVSDARGSVCFRVQRELFGTEHTTSITGVANYFLEDIAFTMIRQLRIIGSIYDPDTREWSLSFLESAPYPQPFSNTVRALSKATTVDSVLAVHLQEFTATLEARSVSTTITTQDLVQLVSVVDDSLLVPYARFLDASLQDVVVEHSLSADSLQTQARFLDVDVHDFVLVAPSTPVEVLQPRVTATTLELQDV